MFRSNVGGAFVGTTIATDGDFRFRTVDMKVEEWAKACGTSWTDFAGQPATCSRQAGRV